MNTECLRIAGQLNGAFSGDPWHGAPIRELLTGVTAEQASRRPLPSAHTIWELVTHIEMYVKAALDATHGASMPKWYGTEKDWPWVAHTTDPAWTEATETLFRSAKQLADAIERFTDPKLQTLVPGRDYDFYYLFHGIVQHSLYHGGQIAMLKKAVIH